MKLPWISRARHERERAGILRDLTELRKRYRELEKTFTHRCQELAEMKQAEYSRDLARGLFDAMGGPWHMSNIKQADIRKPKK